MAAKTRQFQLIQDRQGVVWDVLLYVPTAVALLLIALKLWYGSHSTWAYALVFLASYFLIVGVNRVLRRMILLPTSPVSIDIDKQAVFLNLKNARRVALVKDVRFFPDYSGKSFGLSGMDMAGKSHQYVFHKGQYPSPADFQEIKGLLSVYR
jgi:hypothetical protein